MKKLSDEILNEYIDGELDEKSLEEINKILSSSEEDLKRLTELQAIDRGLREIKEYKVRDNFTSLVMKKINTATKLRKTDKRFIVVITSVFLILSLGTIGYTFYLLLPAVSTSETSNQNVNSFVNYFIQNILSFTKLINSQNISILGSVFSLGLLISGYFFFETQKSSKRRMNKFN